MPWHRDRPSVRRNARRDGANGTHTLLAVAKRRRAATPRRERVRRRALVVGAVLGRHGQSLVQAGPCGLLGILIRKRRSWWVLARRADGRASARVVQTGRSCHFQLGATVDLFYGRLLLCAACRALLHGRRRWLVGWFVDWLVWFLFVWLLRSRGWGGGSFVADCSTRRRGGTGASSTSAGGSGTSRSQLSASDARVSSLVLEVEHCRAQKAVGDEVVWRYVGLMADRALVLLGVQKFLAHTLIAEAVAAAGDEHGVLQQVVADHAE